MKASLPTSALTIVLLGCATAPPASGPPSSAPTPSVASGVRFTRGTMARSIDSMVNDPQFRSATWGILIVDPLANDTLYSHNATKLLIPASNQKLVVSSVMLEKLGPQYRYRTVVAARGSIVEGTLQGDLAIIGRGDPTASNHMKIGRASCRERV